MRPFLARLLAALLVALALFYAIGMALLVTG